MTGYTGRPEIEVSIVHPFDLDESDPLVRVLLADLCPGHRLRDGRLAHESIVGLHSTESSFRQPGLGCSPRGGVEMVGDCGCYRLTMEREKGFEPSTSTLARLHSTTELLPQWVGSFSSDPSASSQAPRCRWWRARRSSGGYGRPSSHATRAGSWTSRWRRKPIRRARLRWEQTCDPARTRDRSGLVCASLHVAATSSVAIPEAART